MLRTLAEVLGPARAGGYAVGAFEFWSLDSAHAIVEAAETVGAPVILQAGPLEIEFAGLQALSEIARAVAGNSQAEVALHLDHGETVDLAAAAIDAGFTSVMIDASGLPYEENRELTRRVVELAHPRGVSVEAELGRLAGAEARSDVSEEDAMQTDPEEARRFVEETGVDALAVAVGTAHGLYAYEPKLNLARLREVASKVPVPLVLHGGSGTPDEQVKEAIELGIAKVNVCTELVAAFGRAYLSVQQEPGFKYNVPSLFGAGKSAARELAAAKMRLFSGRRQL
jgi:fructose-bisphosphate aldolase class II